MIYHRRSGPRRAGAGREHISRRHVQRVSIRTCREDVDGLRRLFKQFSFPGGIPSHVAPETPGSIHEGGELGYSLSHAYGAAFDNPGSDRLRAWSATARRRPDRSPTSWHSNKFLNPVRDGAVLPILHLNGYKIAGPTVLARIPRRRADAAAHAATATSRTSSKGDDPRPCIS